MNYADLDERIKAVDDRVREIEDWIKLHIEYHKVTERVIDE